VEKNSGNCDNLRRHFMKKVLFLIIAVTLMTIFLACGKTDTGKGSGTAGKGDECFTALDCKTGYKCINGYCVDFSTDNDENTTFIQNTATPYCEKVEECNPEAFNNSFDDVENCSEEFISDMTDWYKEKSTECHKAYESLMTCVLELDCDDFNSQTGDNPCFQYMVSYYNLCEAEEPICSEGEKKCEGDWFYWCSEGKWYAVDCYESNQKICDENKGCVTEDLF
jgi:hypothetical protein